jgi:hypothetical protein
MSAQSASAQARAGKDENRPVHEIRHRNVRAAIWKNQTVNGVMYTVTISRSYRSGEEWRDSRSFRFDDLPIIAKLMFDAHTYISSLRDPRGSAGRKAPGQAAATSK